MALTYINQLTKTGVLSLFIACFNGHVARLLESGTYAHQAVSEPVFIARAHGHKSLIEIIAARRIKLQSSWFPRFAVLLATFVALVAAYTW